MSQTKKMINRELSWLSFNERVLQESMDKSVPLIERLRFLGIYSSNLDEFFRVKVANINRMIAVKNQKVEGYSGTPKSLLGEVQKTIKSQRRFFDISYQRLLKEMEEHNIFHLNETNIPASIEDELFNHYNQVIKQDIVPIMLEKKRKFPRLRDKEIYLAVKLISGSKNKVRYALIQIPSQHERFITFQRDEITYVLILDDIIRLYLRQIFSIFEVKEAKAYTFKFTRDAELNLDDDFSVSMYDKMEETIKQRKRGEPLRFIYDQEMDTGLLAYLKKSIGISIDDHVAPGGRYHNFKDLMRFPDFGRPELLYPSHVPLEDPEMKNQTSIIKTILEKDVFLHYPYQKFDHLVDFLREAAIDPKVTEIKISIYRVAKRSQVINALINAIKNGKFVTVVVELQARFDEENNMYWSNILREHGAKVIYGIPGLKVHSKIVQVTRLNGKTEQYLAHIGTGNFNGDTAKIYADFSLFTSRPEITKEIKKVFNLLENNIQRGIYKNIFVSPLNTRRKFIELINQEILNAKRDLDARIEIKLNNLVDSKLINKLYDASKSGVKIKIILRGICCLIPQKKGLSENIEVISIVGRYLEHGRFFIFHNNGKPKYFISSADWMTRNLDKRIEVTTPIFNEKIQSEIRNVFDIMWKDNVKARIIDEFQKNKYVNSEEGEEPWNAQQKLIEYYNKL
ncbi:MAG: polyphosphate kinase 1 [Brumimicrobium sp.]